MDMFDCVDPLKAIFRQLLSLLDSHAFEVGQCLASRDQLKMDICLKKFKNQITSMVMEMDRKLDKFERDISSIDVIRRLKEHEEHILTFKRCIESLKEDLGQSENENLSLRKEINIINHGMECKNSDNDDIILKLQTQLEEVTSSNEQHKIYITNHDKDVSQEREFLKEMIKLKDQENKCMKNEISELGKKVQKRSEQYHESLGLARRYEQEIFEYKSQIERCRNLARVDQNNLVNAKCLLNKAQNQIKNQEENLLNQADQLSHQEDQLKSDFDLITKLKNELINVQNDFRTLDEKNKSVSLDLDDERRANVIIYKDMESLQEKLSDINHTLTSLTEKNKLLKEKKKKFSMDADHLKKDLSELEGKNEQLQKDNELVQSSLASLKGKLENVIKQNKSLRKEITFLHATKSISEDKIKLLSSFIEDFRVTEHGYQAKLIHENQSIRSRMDIMRDAYEKLF